MDPGDSGCVHHIWMTKQPTHRPIRDSKADRGAGEMYSRKDCLGTHMWNHGSRYGLLGPTREINSLSGVAHAVAMSPVKLFHPVSPSSLAHPIQQLMIWSMIACTYSVSTTSTYTYNAHPHIHACIYRTYT